MLKKISFSLAIFLVATYSLFSNEFSHDYFDGFTYYYNCLQTEENNFLSSEQNLNEKLTLVQKMHDIVLDFLNTADDEKFYEQLKLSKPFIDMMTKINDSIFFQIYQDRFCDRRPFEFNGIASNIYYNAFSKRTVLTEEERTSLYEEEITRHKNVKLLPRQFLNKESLKTLVSGQTYNFVLTLHNEAYISYNQCYRLKNNDAKSILNSPNHTILAGNAPVFSAGVINYYKVGQKQLYIISCSSGHFHPMPDSLVHIKNYLISLGIPEEAIISFSVAYEKIDTQINKIKYAIPANNNGWPSLLNFSIIHKIP